MNDMDPRLVEVFFEVQRGLPRQGPGDAGSTAKALSLCAELPRDAAILDIGCGPGMQTLTLTEKTAGKIVAVDTCDEYLEQLRERVGEASLSDRVKVMHADMSALEFAHESFDLIWSEGAAYCMGVSEALQAWRPLLRVGGYLAFTELVWLTDEPPEEVAAFFGSEYPAMGNVEAIRQMLSGSGYKLVDDFTLPDSAWWTDYYAPLVAKLPALKQKYEGDEAALSIVGMTDREIDMRRRFSSAYGYQFFVACKDG